ncbi:MAG TPA: hypothetical protein VFZ40_15845 [Pyrinomonadaceae bacterium]
MASVIVSGAIANKHQQGGEAWVRLSWALGLRRLGFQVFFIEQIASDVCVDKAGVKATFEDSENLHYFKTTIEQFGLAGSAALVYKNGEEVWGTTQSELVDRAASADLLVNISGHLSLEWLMSRLRRKVYVDIDPGFTQFWHTDPNTQFRLKGHDFYFTIAENIGAAECSIPQGDLQWRKTRQPVVLDDWPVSCSSEHPFTTIANWRGPFGTINAGNRAFGLKVHEFRKFVDLPRQSSQKFQIALNIHPSDNRDREMLIEHGWQIKDPLSMCNGPHAFRQYVQNSAAEFSVAQGIYVDTNSGWFSDRTVRYLASGKPALVQDTGFSKNLPVGEGLIAFRTLEEAVAGAESIARNYEKHARAARALAEEYFDSDKVLKELLNEVGVAP